MSTTTTRKGNKASTGAVSTDAAVNALKAGLTVAVNVDGNGSQRGNRTSIMGCSVSMLTRAMRAKGYSRTLIQALYAKLGVPVSPQTVKAQAGSGASAKAGEAGHHGVTPDYDKLPEPLRTGLEAVARTIVANEASEPGSMATLARSLKSNVNGAITPELHLPANLR